MNGIEYINQSCRIAVCGYTFMCVMLMQSLSVLFIVYFILEISHGLISEAAIKLMQKSKNPNQVGNIGNFICGALFYTKALVVLYVFIQIFI